jgi:L-rhamnose mutarotase
MKRVGFILKVKKHLIEEYKEHHRNVWPEMQEALRATGWHNYSLFMRDDGLLFGYFETPVSLAEAQAGMAKTEVNERWQSMMSAYFEIPEGAHPDQLMVEMEEVFHLD